MMMSRPGRSCESMTRLEEMLWKRSRDPRKTDYGSKISLAQEPMAKEALVFPEGLGRSG